MFQNKNRDCWTTGAQDARLMVWQLWVPTFLLNLVRTSGGLRPQRLDFFCSRMELSHLVMDESSSMLYLR